MNYRNFLEVVDKQFNADDEITICFLTSELFMPFNPAFLSGDMIESLHNTVFYGKGVEFQDGKFVIKTKAYTVRKDGDVYNKSQGERIAYLKAKTKAVHKARKIYEYICTSFIPQFHEMTSATLNKLNHLEEHLSSYVHELSTK